MVTQQGWKGLPLAAANLVVAGWYGFVATFVLLGVRGEALSGASYSWPKETIIASWALLLIAGSLLTASILAARKPMAALVSALLLLAIASLETYEAVMMLRVYGEQAGPWWRYWPIPGLLLLSSLNLLRWRRRTVIASHRARGR